MGNVMLGRRAVHRRRPTLSDYQRQIRLLGMLYVVAGVLFSAGVFWLANSAYFNNR